MNQVLNDLRSFQTSDWLLMITATAIFLPHTLCIAVLFFSMAYAFFKLDLKQGIKEQKRKKWAYGFILLEIIVCAMNKNLIGFGVTMSFFAVLIYSAYYQKHANEKLLSYIIEWSLILSIVVNVIGLFQFNYVSQLGGYSFFDFEIQNSPSRRITGTFQNANIYALILEYLFTCCVYRYLQVKEIKYKVGYVLLGIFEFCMILLTGCRAALIPLVFVIPLMLHLGKQKKTLLLYFVCLILIIIGVFINPNLIPRIDDISTIESRVKIWKTAIKVFKTYPIFGKGPWTYNLTYSMFNGHKAVHCHNIYLDSLVSYGIAGCALLVPYLQYLGSLIHNMKSKNSLLYGLMVSLTLIICIHGLVDGTIHPLKTDLFYMTIIFSSFIYADPKKMVKY